MFHSRQVWSGRPNVATGEPKTERSRRFVPIPSPVAAMLKRHRVSQAAERLAVPVWVPWENHPDLVFPTVIGTPTDPEAS
jgi:hypothetical protein